MFYSLYVVNGSVLMQVTGADSVIHALNAQGGVYMFGRMMPVWAVILIEFIFAYGLECVMGSPCSFRLAYSRSFGLCLRHCSGFSPNVRMPGQKRV